MYSIKSTNIFNYAKFNQPVSQNKTRQNVSFRGDFDEFYNGFAKIKPDEQKSLFKELLNTADKYNFDLVNRLRKSMGLKSRTNFDWKNGIHELYLQEHTVEEYTKSLLKFVVSNMKGLPVEKKKGYIGIEHSFYLNGLTIELTIGNSGNDYLKIKEKNSHNDLLDLVFDNKGNLLKFNKSVESATLTDPEIIDLYNQVKNKMLGIKDRSAKSDIYKIKDDFSDKPVKSIWRQLANLFHPDNVPNNKEFSKFDKKRSENYMKAVTLIGNDYKFGLLTLIDDWNEGKEEPSCFKKYA